MLHLIRQTKAQIWLVNDDFLSLYIWDQQAFSFITRIANNEQKLSEFTESVRQFQSMPAILVTDFQEESYRHDKIAHVSGSDQSAIISRKLNFTFRNTPYRLAKVIGREPDGRKDDKILLGALTRPELIDPWVKILLAHNVSIQSITSMAFVMEAYFQKNKLSDGPDVVLASLERGTELRQTYLKNGKVQFSRMTSLNSSAPADIGEDIFQESQQIRKYLERIRLLSYENPLEVFLFCPYTGDNLHIPEPENHLNNYTIIRVEDQLPNYNVNLEESEPEASVLFLADIVTKKPLRNVYAPLSAQKFHFLRTWSRAAVVASVTLSLLAIFFQVPKMIDTYGMWQQEAQLASLTQPWLQQYDELSQEFPETPIPSQEMALVVETYETVRSQSYRPANAMAVISEALTYSPNLQITGIEWMLTEKAPDPSEPPPRYTPQPNDGDTEVFTYAVLEQNTGLTIVIEGIAYSPRSYREAQNQVLAFTEALEELTGATVTPTRMPTEVRVDGNVSTTVNDSELRAQFTVEVELQGA